MDKKYRVEEDFDTIISKCQSIFYNKMKDYGATWILFRWPSLVDQLWIKIKRIRTLEQNGDKCLIPEGRDVEYIGIINYCLIGLIKFYHSDIIPTSDNAINNISILKTIDINIVMEKYSDSSGRIKELMLNKNHDYGEAWRDMSLISITDQIIIKILRVKNIIDNDRRLIVSEDIDAQLSDIINYCIFALIKLESIDYNSK
ncbi:DUF1599 domain-containing protein [Pelosinus fermentans]|uniref:Nucleotide modification associated domain-containing protein n=1 Tax=Pelosinus fermentans JBW45 TaxID=1192197 RepID=I8U323_9FIRM|nr:DUF1599 domain-containing protein [Pelosinus fermentans]AJQ29130.1 protein of unknown function DUF1599 [Pelosinus fermentans JBW45]